jgi:hemerythrin
MGNAAMSDAATANLIWNDRFLVGHGTIDRTHAEFVELLDGVFRASDDILPGLLAALATHLESHFAFEEQLMREYKFPPGDCHADEHARVMASVREVCAEIAAGSLENARPLAQALADWFPGHIDYMDSALAIWIVKKQTAGAPVVLRRPWRSTTGAVC